MHYYQHHVGDYQRDTATLNLLEHGAYRLLMDAYYVTEQALPANREALYRICRAMTAAEQGAVRRVVTRYFQEQDGYLLHARIEDELADYTRRVESATEAGKRGAALRRSRQSAVAGAASATGDATALPVAAVAPPDSRPQSRSRSRTRAQRPAQRRGKRVLPPDPADAAPQTPESAAPSAAVAVGESNADSECLMTDVSSQPYSGPYSQPSSDCAANQEPSSNNQRPPSAVAEEGITPHLDLPSPDVRNMETLPTTTAAEKTVSDHWIQAQNKDHDISEKPPLSQAAHEYPLAEWAPASAYATGGGTAPHHHHQQAQQAPWGDIATQTVVTKHVSATRSTSLTGSRLPIGTAPTAAATVQSRPLAPAWQRRVRGPLHRCQQYATRASLQVCHGTDAASPGAAPVTPDWLHTMQTRYPHAQVSREWPRCLSWCEQHGTTPNRHRMVAWLNRIPLPVATPPGNLKPQDPKDYYAQGPQLDWGRGMRR